MQNIFHGMSLTALAEKQASTHSLGRFNTVHGIERWRSMVYSGVLMDIVS